MRRTTELVGLLVLAMALVGWGERKQYGAPVKETAPVVALKEIGADPATYKDKEVVLKGNYGFYCCPSDFSYKEGLEIAHVAPNGFDSPKLKTGTPIALYGVVRVGHLPEEEAESKSDEESEEAHASPEFFIEAKGVALR